MQFANYLLEIWTFFQDKIMSGLFNLFSSVISWCATMSYEFWNESFVRALLNASIAVSGIVWAVAFIIMLLDVVEAISEEKPVFISSLAGDAVKALAFYFVAPNVGQYAILFVFEIVKRLNWADSLEATLKQYLTSTLGSVYFGIVLLIGSIYFFFASLKNSGLFFCQLLTCPLYVPSIVRGDHTAMGAWLRQSVSILLTFFFQYLMFYSSLFLFFQGQPMAAIMPMLAMMAVPRLLDKYGFSSGSGGIGQTLSTAAYSIMNFVK